MHPMVVLSAMINLTCMFFLTGGLIFPDVTIGMVLLAWLLSMLMIPGLGGQVFLISGTQWTLFYEYLANVLYATVTGALAVGKNKSNTAYGKCLVRCRVTHFIPKGI